MTDKLEPCPTPWCDHAEPPYLWQGPTDDFTLICPGCNVEGPYAATEELATEAWNTRTSPDKDRIEALEGALRKAKPLIIAHMNSVHKTSDYLAVRGFLDEIAATLTPTAGGER